MTMYATLEEAIDAARKNFWLTIRASNKMKECAAVQRSEICTAGWGHHVAGRIFRR